MRLDANSTAAASRRLEDDPGSQNRFNLPKAMRKDGLPACTSTMERAGKQVKSKISTCVQKQVFYFDLGLATKLANKKFPQEFGAQEKGDVKGMFKKFFDTHASGLMEACDCLSAIKTTASQAQCDTYADQVCAAG